VNRSYYLGLSVGTKIGNFGTFKNRRNARHAAGCRNQPLGIRIQLYPLIATLPVDSQRPLSACSRLA